MLRWFPALFQFKFKIQKLLRSLNKVAVNRFCSAFYMLNCLIFYVKRICNIQCHGRPSDLRRTHRREWTYTIRKFASVIFESISFEHDEFRVRLVDHRVLPIVGNDSLFAQQQMVVIDYPDVEVSSFHLLCHSSKLVQKPRFEDVDEDKENTIHTADTVWNIRPISFHLSHSRPFKLVADPLLNLIF